jgi:hypothetical protein
VWEEENRKRTVEGGKEEMRVSYLLRIVCSFAKHSQRGVFQIYSQKDAPIL